MPEPTKRRILVVDDDVALSKLITRILEGRGHSIVECHTGVDAVKMLLE
jgi:CheY-like chemotaxis protein